MSNATVAGAEQLLGAAEPFTRLKPRTLRRLAGAAKETQHSSGKEILEEGSTPVGFHLIVDGTVDVEAHGRVVASLGKGESFGFMSLIDGKPRSATVRATSDVRTLFIAPWIFRPLLAAEPTIAQDLLPILCEYVRRGDRD